MAIPLLLHLRRSRHSRKIVFSTTRFFDPQFIRLARRARLQDLILMILRMVLLALFTLALAQPLVRSRGFFLLGRGGGHRIVALVIDDSASMGAVSDRGVLFARAKQGALSIVDELMPSQGDRATVILAGRRGAGVQVLFDPPTNDLDAVRREIEHVKLTDLATDLNAAIKQAGQVIGAEYSSETNPKGREVYVFSDFQASGAAPEKLDTPGKMAGLFLVSTRPRAATQRDNISVDAVQYGAARPMLGVPFTVRVLLTNHSRESRLLRTSLVIDGQPVSSKQVDLAAARSRMVRFTYRFTEPGWFSGSVELKGSSADQSTDILEADNHRYFALQVQHKIRLLAINGAPSQIGSGDELHFFRLAMTVRPERDADGTFATRLVEIEEITPDQVEQGQLDGYRLALLANVADLSDEALEALERFVDAGGSLLITLGDRVSIPAYAKWIGANRLHEGLLPAKLIELVQASETKADAVFPNASDKTRASATPDDFIASVNESHPAMAGFGDDGLGRLDSVQILARYRLDARPADVLMQNPYGEPLLVEKRFGLGKVMLFASSIDRDWTNFPLQPTYLPWVYRLVSYLMQPSGPAAGFVRTGEVVELPVSVTRLEPMKLLCPDGTVRYPEPDRSPGGTASVLSNTDHAGVYELHRASDTDTQVKQAKLLFAANIPSDESRPEYLDEGSMGKMIDPHASWVYVDEPESVSQAGELARQGYGLWDHLFLLALAVVLVEPWLANRLSRRLGAAASGATGLDRLEIARITSRDAA